MTPSRTQPPDVGLFGPDSVTWRVHGDPAVMWVGGVRALLLQALHPLAMAGVAQHSNFRSDPWGRLDRTGDYLATVTFGDTAAAEQAATAVRHVHHGLSGVEPETEQPYRVSDPALLLWVHCCEIDSLLSTARRSGLRLPPEEADEYVREQVEAARLMRVPRRLVPASVDDLTEYFEQVRSELFCTRAARQGVAFLLWPPMSARLNLCTPARPAWTTLATLAVAALPPWARRLYGLPGLASTDVTATAAVLGAGHLARLLPPRWREHPYHRQALDRCTGAQQIT